VFLEVRASVNSGVRGIKELKLTEPGDGDERRGAPRLTLSRHDNNEGEARGGSEGQKGEIAANKRPEIATLSWWELLGDRDPKLVGDRDPEEL
jgi:hypothetical protein